MRVRSIVLPVALAVAAAVAVPAQANAGTEQCTLILPTKVVVDGRFESVPVRFGANCDTNGAAAAFWEVGHSSGDYWDAYFDEDSYTAKLTRGDGDALGRYTGYGVGAFTASAWASQDPVPDVTQNTPVMTIKYGSKLTTAIKRTARGLSWSVAATQWSTRANKYVPRPKVRVGVFHQKNSSSPWTYVKSMTTSGTGRATVAVGTTKTGNYRLKVAETPTVWASYSSAVRGRI
jgi:hypothetical protein